MKCSKCPQDLEDHCDCCCVEFQERGYLPKFDKFDRHHTTKKVGSE
jgi:hypothetical protein